jgi:hypothetical protein
MNREHAIIKLWEPPAYDNLLSGKELINEPLERVDPAARALQGFESSRGIGLKYC